MPGGRQEVGELRLREMQQSKRSLVSELVTFTSMLHTTHTAIVLILTVKCFLS